MKLFGKTTAVAAAAAIAMCAASVTACAEGEYWNAPVSAVYSSMDNRGFGDDTANGIPDGIVMKTGAFDNAGDAAAEYSVSLIAEADRTECYVGDNFIVTITAKNVGSSDLSNFRVYFEDRELHCIETFVPGQDTQMELILIAEESDIGVGSILNISATADELDEPVRKAVKITVLPGEQNPATGSDSSVLLLAAVSGLAVAAFRRKRK